MRLVPGHRRRSARAISMSVKQILKSEEIIAIVPGAQKARAVKACLEGEVQPHGARLDPAHPSQTARYISTQSRIGFLTESTIRTV